VVIVTLARFIERQINVRAQVQTKHRWEWKVITDDVHVKEHRRSRILHKRNLPRAKQISMF